MGRLDDVYEDYDKLKGRAERLERNLRYISYHRNALGQKLIELLPEARQELIEIELRESNS